MKLFLGICPHGSGNFIFYFESFSAFDLFLLYLCFVGLIYGKTVNYELLYSLKNGCCIAPLTVILLDGSRCIIYVNRSMASGIWAKAWESFTKFSFPFTLHLGKVGFISGKFSLPCQSALTGVPRVLNILNSYPISLSP